VLIKRAVGSAWGWDADTAEQHYPEERGPAVIPFRAPPAAKQAASAGAAPERTADERLGLLLESDAPAEPWPRRPMLRQTTDAADAPEPAPIPAFDTKVEAKPAVFPRISRAESNAPAAAEPFRAVLQRYADDHAEPTPAPAPAAAKKPAPAARPAERRAAAPPPQQNRTARDAGRARREGRPEAAAEQAYAILTGIGLADDIAEEALLEAVRVMPAEALAHSDRLIEVALARLVAGLPKGPPLTAALAGCQVFFIGPAGAGKTTALLKAAVRLRDAGVDVGIVGADLSRIGAREQLARYGELLRLPVAAAYAPEELAQIIASAPPTRALLIDTAACALGPRTPRPLPTFAPELAALLAVAPRRVPVLVLPAGARDADLLRLRQLARAAGAVAATITRLDDEVEQPVPAEALPAAGLALNALARLQLPPLLCCTGRDVLSGHAAPSAMELAVAALETAALG
jgi:hypothetical protein